MSVEELVEELIDLGVKLDIDQENLKVIGLQKKDAPAVLPRLKEHKKELMEYIRSLRSNNASGVSAEAEFELAETQDYYSLSPSQRRLWVLGQLSGGRAAYNMPSTVYFDEAFDRPLLEKAINAVIDRHEILRTVFREDSNRDPKQVVLPKSEVNFELGYRDFGTFENPEEKAIAYFESVAYRDFDLKNWPLINAEVLRLADDNYIFFYNMHHIISDGWSMDVLLAEVMAFYKAYQEGVSPDLQPLRIQYKDYAHTVNKRLESGAYDSQRMFWKIRLEGELPLLTIPSALKRPDYKTYAGTSFELLISPEMTRRLNDFCIEKEASLFTGLLAVWSVLLYRYTGDTDIITGTPVAGRDHPELEQQIGFYINMIPLRNELNPGEDFNSNFEQIKKDTLSAFSNRQYPFDYIVEAIDLTFHPARNAIFDVILSLQNTGEIDEEAVFSDVGIQRVGIAAAKYDLEVTFKEVANFLSFNIITNNAIYPEEIVRNLMTHFTQLLGKLLDNPTVKLNELDFLSDKEKDDLIYAQVTNTDKVPNYTVLDTFRELVKNFPDETIARSGEAEMTVAELDELSDRLAQELLDLGVHKGDFIPICFERSLEMLVAIVGVLKSGGAYVPLDIAQPQERLDFIIKDTEARIVVTTKEYNDLFKAVTTLITEDLGSFKNEKTELPTVIANDRAYAIYTSGTTGNPKGVVNRHKGLVNRLEWMRDLLSISANDCLLQKTPYTFDVSVWELLMPIFTGAKLIFAKPEGHKETLYLEQLIDQEQVTLIHFVPSMLNAFLSDLEGKCESLKYIICSGEALPTRVAANCHQKLNTRLYNFYGPTEAAIDVTFTEIPKEISEQGLITIGKPAANTRIYILNEKGLIQPNGVIGEIIIAGIQVAEGYINRPELNDKVFISDPFIEGEQAYRTGDLGWKLPNGEIVYVDRKDNQVKIRGNRIELEEIENALNQIAYVKDSLVIAKTDEFGEKNLVAYLVSQEEQNNSDLRNYLLRKLPAYMVPTYFVKLDKIPLTRNGKVDRKALPTPGGLYTLNKVEYVEPTTEREKQLAVIWEQILKHKPISLTDNFFDLGGHSLKATQLVSRVYKTLKLELNINAIFMSPTLKEQAKLLEDQNQTNYQDIKLLQEPEITPGKSSIMSLNVLQPNKPPFFMVPPITGRALLYSGFTQRLRNQFNFYGFNYKGADFTEEPDKTIDQMADRFARELINKAPPSDQVITILGFSMGATIAYEMVRILENQGYQCHLILVDRAPNIEKYEEGVGLLTEEEKRAYAVNYIHQLYGGLPNDETEKYTAFLVHNAEILEKHRTKENIKSRIDCIQAEKTYNSDAMSDWKQFTTGTFSLQFIPFEHDEIFTPEQVGYLANLLTLNYTNH